MSSNKTFAIGAVSRLLGISTHALRKWEMRYGAISPARSEGGDRRYSEGDVERLSRLTNLVSRGHPIGTIASLSNDALAELIGEDPVVASSSEEPIQCVVVGGRLWAELESSLDGFQHTSFIEHVNEADALVFVHEDHTL